MFAANEVGNYFIVISCSHQIKFFSDGFTISIDSIASPTHFEWLTRVAQQSIKEWTNVN